MAAMTVEETRRKNPTRRSLRPALVIVDRKSGAPAKTFPYAEMKGAEYSYAKSPRWKTAILVSPSFLFIGGKKFEARTGLKVDTVADTK